MKTLILSNLFLISFLICTLFSCNTKPSKPAKLTSNKFDSLQMKLLEDDEQYRKDSADQSRITRLNLETFQRLQDKGYSYDRAIHYLDSMNHKIYNGNFPQWYNEWKERIDTTLKYH